MNYKQRFSRWILEQEPDDYFDDGKTMHILHGKRVVQTPNFYSPAMSIKVIRYKSTAQASSVFYGICAGAYESEYA